jgi:hypothetical protein
MEPHRLGPALLFRNPKFRCSPYATTPLPQECAEQRQVALDRRRASGLRALGKSMNLGAYHLLAYQRRPGRWVRHTHNMLRGQLCCAACLKNGDQGGEPHQAAFALVREGRS